MQADKILILLLTGFGLVYAFSNQQNRVYAYGGGGSSPDGITLKLQGVNEL